MVICVWAKDLIAASKILNVCEPEMEIGMEILARSHDVVGLRGKLFPTHGR